ncbi:MAG TPA: hypothetical protein VLG13_02450 [Patescibacteria group bacterium]|nr:hypothetical protein [Patescibacteria group bacterium]
MTEQNTNQPKIIDEVPGFENSGMEARVIQPGEVAGSMSTSEFRGDPRKVIGHPSNPASNIEFAGVVPPTPQEVGDTVLDAAEAAQLISVPDDIKNPQ